MFITVPQPYRVTLLSPMKIVHHLCLLLLGGHLVLAQEAPADTAKTASAMGTMTCDIISSTASGIRTSVTHPALRRHWTAFGVGSLLALTVEDELLLNRRRLMPDQVAQVGDMWGGILAATTVLPIIFAVDHYENSPGDKILSDLQFAASSLLVVGATTSILKLAVDRERPNRVSRHWSFPSGHTSASFGVAEALRTIYGNRFGAPFYALAIITGFSRIHDNKHYLSDVVAGAGLGIGIVRGFALDRSAHRLTVSPDYINGNAALRLSFTLGR
ncbi:MAG: phosphatase PAP2 family protein [Candidatus Marinimicrobia bacterium]|nr:phosphatase PAP2 family protein [Candidatus Neomarinimicrobiota bacterium]